jgi:prepilin-type N-terminal cleavage/methylation domain-containing protein
MKKITNGFTIIELLVVVAIVGVLATIGIVTFSSVQSGVRNTQRSTKITIISEALEKYYEKNGEYPSCAVLTTTASTVTTTVLRGLDPNVLTSPSASLGTNSITCTDISGSSDSSVFAYVGDSSQWTLKYKEEGSGNTKSLDSRRRTTGSVTTYTLTTIPGAGGTVSSGGTYNSGTTQAITATANSGYNFSSWSGAGCSGGASSTVTMSSNITCTANFTVTAIAAPATPSVSVSAGSTSTWSWGAASCPGNTVQYQYYYNYAGYWAGPITSTSVSLSTATDGLTYTVSVQAQCYNTATTSAWSASGSASYVRPNNWITGRGNLAGRYIYNVDTASRSYWSVASSSCSNIGGRLPSATELVAIYNDRAYYGNNFGDEYWTNYCQNSDFCLGIPFWNDPNIYSIGYCQAEGDWLNARCIKP